MSENSNQQFCLNCNTPFHEAIEDRKEIFCHNCGQSSKESKLSFGRLIKDAISNVLNLDSRLIHTFRDIFRPSKLTRFYISGKRKYYVNPARLFIFTLIGLITLSLFTIKLENNDMGVDKLYSRTERSKVMDEFDDLIDTLDTNGRKEIIDSIRSKMFKRVRSIKTDTLGKNGPNINMVGRDVQEFGITRYDALHLTRDSLFNKYEIIDFWDQLNVSQHIRLITNPAGTIKYMIKNLTWAVFITVILIGFFIKALYSRHSYYLVEHLVLVLNGHAMLFIMIAINIVCLVYIPFGKAKEIALGNFIGLSMLALFIIQFLSLKKYYQQGIFKTLIKQIMINFVYSFIFVSVVALVAIISLLLY